MAKFQVKAPTRIDLLGGTLDISPVCWLLEEPCTINVAIDLFGKVNFEVLSGHNFHLVSRELNVSASGDFLSVSEVRQSTLPLVANALKYCWSAEYPTLRIELASGSPAGAGLGGSSALLLAVCYGLEKLKRLLDIVPKPMMGDEQIVELAQNIETSMIEVPTGCQDYWSAVRGGLNLLEFQKHGLQVETMSSETFGHLSQDLLVCFSGQSRGSASSNWQIFRKIFEDSDFRERVRQFSFLSVKGAVSLRDRDWEGFISSVRAENDLRQSLFADVMTEQLQTVLAAGRQAGAYFGKVCGAGGGGVCAFFVTPQHRASVAAALAQIGGVVLPAQVTNRGISFEELS